MCLSYRKICVSLDWIRFLGSGLVLSPVPKILNPHWMPDLGSEKNQKIVNIATFLNLVFSV
jgi:hypothetical protein